MSKFDHSQAEGSTKLPPSKPPVEGDPCCNGESEVDRSDYPVPIDQISGIWSEVSDFYILEIDILKKYPFDVAILVYQWDTKFTPTVFERGSLFQGRKQFVISCGVNRRGISIAPSTIAAMAAAAPIRSAPSTPLRLCTFPSIGSCVIPIWRLSEEQSCNCHHSNYSQQDFHTFHHADLLCFLSMRLFHKRRAQKVGLTSLAKTPL